MGTSDYSRWVRTQVVTVQGMGVGSGTWGWSCGPSSRLHRLPRGGGGAGCGESPPRELVSDSYHLPLCTKLPPAPQQFRALISLSP